MRCAAQIPQERVISNLEEYGNTSAASIPLALDEAVRAGSVKSGDTVRLSTNAYSIVNHQPLFNLNTPVLLEYPCLV